MSSARRAPVGLVLVVGALLAGMVLLLMVRRNVRPELAPSVPAPARAGTGIVVLVDTSGSMADPVPDVGGRATPKIEIARRAVLSLLRRVEEFSKKSPGLTVEAGVYEFSASGLKPVARPVVPMGRPDAAGAQAAIQRMTPSGNTPIGDAMILGKKELDRSGLRSAHLLVVTDGENTHGPDPGQVAQAFSQLPVDRRPAMYFVAFDVEAAKFAAVKRAGGLVLSASDERQLQETLDYILGEKILIEK